MQVNPELFETPLAVASHPYLFKATSSPIAPDRYKKKITLLLPKERADVIEFRQKYLETLGVLIRDFQAKHGFEPDTRGAMLVDGDQPKRSGKHAGKVIPEEAGHWVLDPWAEPKTPLQLSYIDEHGVNRVCTDEDDIYYGAHVTAVCSFFTYTKGTPGISVSLHGVCRRAPGKRLGGRPPARDIWATFGLSKPVAEGEAAPRLAAPNHGNIQLPAPRQNVQMPEITDPETRHVLGLPPL